MCSAFKEEAVVKQFGQFEPLREEKGDDVEIMIETTIAYLHFESFGRPTHDNTEVEV